MLKGLSLISIFFVSSLQAAITLSPIEVSSDFFDKYGTSGLLASSPPAQFIHKEIEGSCYMIVRDKSMNLSIVEAESDKC